jgi:hypothetical protein
MLQPGDEIEQRRLADPDSPGIATSSPRATSKEMPASTVRGRGPGKTFVTFARRIKARDDIGVRFCLLKAAMIPVVSARRCRARSSARTGLMRIDEGIRRRRICDGAWRRFTFFSATTWRSVRVEVPFCARCRRHRGAEAVRGCTLHVRGRACPSLEHRLNPLSGGPDAAPLIDAKLVLCNNHLASDNRCKYT